MKHGMRVEERNSGVFVIHHFLSSAECAGYLSLGDELGYAASEVDFPNGSRRAEEVRNNDRVVFDDAPLADVLFERARPMLPSAIAGGTLSGFNERMRFYRYGPQQYFKWHKDGSFAKGPDEASALTFMIFLNDGFDGGATEFNTEFITPRAGMALVFPHRLSHQGTEVRSGFKYVLRTDVMYKRTVGNP